MTCEQVEALLDRYVHDELDSDVAGKLAEHLQACPACGRACDGARALHEEMRALPVEKCPDPVVRRIFAATIVRPTAPGLGSRLRAFLRRRPVHLALSGVALLTVIILGAISWRHNLAKRAVPPGQSYTEAELLNQRVLIEQALAHFFKAVRKSEIIAKDEVTLARLIEPAQKSILRAINPSKHLKEGSK